MHLCFLQDTRSKPGKNLLTANEKEAERQTHRAVVEEIEQGNEEGASVLPVPTDHGVKMGAKSRV